MAKSRILKIFLYTFKINFRVINKLFLRFERKKVPMTTSYGDAFLLHDDELQNSSSLEIQSPSPERPLGGALFSSLRKTPARNEFQRAAANNSGESKRSGKNPSIIPVGLAGAAFLIVVLCVHSLSLEYRLSVLSKQQRQQQREQSRHEGALEMLLQRFLELEQRMEEKEEATIDLVVPIETTATTTAAANDESNNNADNDNRNTTGDDNNNNSEDDDKRDDTIPGNGSLSSATAKSTDDSIKTRAKRNAIKKEGERARGKTNNNNNSSRGRASGGSVALPLIHMVVNASSSRLKQPDGADARSFKFWKESDWIFRKMTRGMFHLDRSTGHVSVTRGGVYLAYFQIVYHDAIGRWSAGLVVNDETRAKCLESEQLKDISDYSETSHGVYKQCSLTTLLKLDARQTVSVRCMYGHRTILSQPEFTFWGLVKIA